MKIIGGEIERKKSKEFEYITNSGRSSIRLILKKLKDKKFLVPNYLCEIILDVLKEFQVNYSFYNVNSDLSIDKNSINSNYYEVIYIINYFGQQINFKDIIDDDIIIVEDNVFLPQFKNYDLHSNWVGFNSFRKLSFVADGSIIKSTLTLPEEFIENDESDFSEIKYKAKDMKYNFIKHNKYSEKEYLSLFQCAEKILNEQKKIHRISNLSLIQLLDYFRTLEKERMVRASNYKFLENRLRNISIKINADFPSFYVLFLENRDELRKYLFSKNIFCPVHWPKPNGISNQLYDMSLSIPIDSRYDKSDMESISKFVTSFIGL